MYIETSARGLLSVFFRRQQKFYFMFALVALLGIGYLTTIKQVYDAHGSFIIKFGQDAVPDMSRTPTVNGDNPSVHSEMIQSNMRILQSDDLLATAISKIGVDRLYPGIKAEVNGTDSPEHEAIVRLQKHDLVVTNDSESSIVDVTVKNRDRIVAKAFVDALITAFIARQTEIYSAPATEFLDKQLAESKRNYEDAQKEFQDFKEQVGISNLDQEETSLLAEKTALSGFSLQAVSTSQENLSKLESDLAAAMTTYRPESPVVQRLKDGIAVAKQNVHGHQQDLNTAGVDTGMLSPKIAMINNRMAYLEQNRGEYSRLEQNVALNQDDYKTYREHSEEARGNALLGEQGITRISVVDKAAVPFKAEPRKRGMFMMGFLMAAMALGLGVVMLFEMMDESAAFPEQIASSLGLPVITSFGKVEKI